MTSDDNKSDYLLIDSDFQVEFSIDIPKAYQSIAPEYAIYTMYAARNLPIARNIARFYLQHFKYQKRGPRWDLIREWRNDVDRYYPELQYGVKYYPCVINQLKQRMWIKGL